MHMRGFWDRHDEYVALSNLEYACEWFFLYIYGVRGL